MGIIVSKKSPLRSASALTIAAIALVLVAKVFDARLYQNPRKVIDNDVINFYSYLPALFAEGDLTLSFAREAPDRYISGGHYWPEILPDGALLIKTTMGLSLLYCPFFLVAHVLAGPLGYATDGFSPPYALALILACVFWVVVGCIYLRRVLLAHFSECVTAIVLLVTVFATNLLWYCTYEAPYSHGFLFGLICVFLYQTERWHRRPTWWGTVALGLNMGLIALIRPTDALVAVYFLLYGVGSWRGLADKVALCLRQWPKMLVMVLAVVVVWLPQMAYWHYITGHLFFFSYTSNEHFFWSDPKIIEGLFGFRKGWLVYTPVICFALAGLVPLYRRHRQFFWGTVAFLVLDIYVLMCWWCWWYGGSFGQRSMVDGYGLLALPLAAFVQWMAGRRLPLRIPLVVLFCGVTYLSFFHYKQYKHEAIHYEAMTREAYFDSFGHKHHSARFFDLVEWPDYEAAKQGKR